MNIEFFSGVNNKSRFFFYLWLILIEGYFKIMILGVAYFDIGINGYIESRNK